MTELALLLVALCAGTALYAYLGYPLALWLLGTLRPAPELPAEDPVEWPAVSVSLPVHNEAGVIAETLESLLALDYPADRLQIVVVSDASTDRTDEIVRSYLDRGVELVRLEERGGKTAAENAAVPHLAGSIVVSTDATIRILPRSLKELVRVFQDPEIGIASGHDRSVARSDEDPVLGESRYVRYEMWVRELETRVGSIVGASGCFYAARRALHQHLVPEELSRDFIAALRATQKGYRAVSVPDAVALVPRARSLGSEFRRKVRTMARGLDSLWFARGALSPFRTGSYAWMLASHKLARWLVPATVPGALLGLGWLAADGSVAARVALGAAAAVAALGTSALSRSEGESVSAPLAWCGYVVVAIAAGVTAWSKALARERKPIWEPTRRGSPAPES